MPFAGDAYLTWVAIYLLLALILVGFMRYFGERMALATQPSRLFNRNQN